MLALVMAIGPGGGLGCRGEPAAADAAIVDDPGFVVAADHMLAGARSGAFAAGVTAYHWHQAWVDNAAAAGPYRHAFLSGVQPGFVLIDLAWPDASSTTRPTAAALRAGLQQDLQLLVTEATAAGGGVLIQIVGPPRWASSAPGNDAPILPGQNEAPIWSRSAPDPAVSYDAWRFAVGELAGWLAAAAPSAVADGRIALAYAVELNNEELYSPIATYAPAYAAFSAAARAAAPSMLVGGGGVSNPWAIKTAPASYADGTGTPALRRWLEGCAPLGCPIDFVTWHSFTILPTPWGREGRGTGMDDTAGQIAAWLAGTGYVKTALVPVDLTTWEFRDQGTGRVPSHPWLSSEEDTEYKAAFVAASAIAARSAGTLALTIGALFETTSLPGEWIGDWGLLTNAGVAKPSFHAAALTSRLEGVEPIEASGAADADPFLAIAAGGSPTAARILVSRFVPDVGHQKAMLVKAFGTRLLRLGYTAETLCTAGLCTEAAAEQVLQNHDVTGLTLEPRLMAVIEDWWRLDDAAKAAPGQVRAPIVVTGLAAGTWRATITTVSSLEGNAYDLCVRRGDPCSDPADVNARTAPQTTTLEVVAAPSRSITIPVTLERAQVTLVELAAVSAPAMPSIGR